MNLGDRKGALINHLKGEGESAWYGLCGHNLSLETARSLAVICEQLSIEVDKAVKEK